MSYALTVWRFFRDRTEEEEISLIHFFFSGEEYLEYKKRVPTGLPFIKWGQGGSYDRPRVAQARLGPSRLRRSLGTELPPVDHSTEWIFLIIFYVINYSSGISLKIKWSEGLRTKGTPPAPHPTPTTLEQPALG